MTTASKPTIGTYRGKPLDENMSKAELLEIIRFLCMKQLKIEREMADYRRKFMEDML